MKYYLAIDIGASSGRAILGHEENNEVILEEIYRFSNGVKELEGHLTWDIDYLFNEVKSGIKEALKLHPIESLSIDTWGVDYVLVNNDETIYPVYSYRDNRTSEIIDEVHSIIPFERLYELTGSQFQTFTSIYQLYWDKKNGRLDKATDHLMIPEYLMYRLTGVKVNEFTGGTTLGLINKDTLEVDEEIINKLGLPKKIFKKFTSPRTIVGDLKEDIQKEVNGNIKVVLCPVHDTACAVEGIPGLEDQLYISSGTWSLLGAKTDKMITSRISMEANYSNEGGVGYNRFQKNIMGMWLINELRKDLCPNMPFNEIVELAKKSTYDELVDANDDNFFAPKSMKEAFEKCLNIKPIEIGDYFRCAYRSLAMTYKKAIDEIEEITNKKYEKLFIVGGGAKNEFLNKLTEEYTNKKIIALPIEATALGNVINQIKTK